MDARNLLLTTALRHRISEPNIETGYERFCVFAGQSVDYQSFCATVSSCLSERLIHEPIRLPEGALQCHWHLELTSAGVALARSLLTPSATLPRRAGEEE